MQAVTETTGGLFPAHTYLLDGTNLVAYIRVNTQEVKYFTQPIKGFSRSGRRFQPASMDLFNVPQVQSHVKTVAGSREGVSYTVDLDQHTCTCPGFTFRGRCRHLELEFNL